MFGVDLVVLGLFLWRLLAFSLMNDLDLFKALIFFCLVYFLS